MNGWAVFIILLIAVVFLGGAGVIIHRQYRARRLGIPAPPLNPFAKTPRSTTNAYQPPAPASGGPLSWLTSKFQSLTNPRSSAGAYEGTSYRTGSHSNRRGFDPLDPDEAWDTRVGNEADYGLAAGGAGPYYEGGDTELGLRDPRAGYAEIGGGERGRSRSRQRELDERYEEEVHGAHRGEDARSNPFGDGAERSELRGVSPRPDRAGSRRSAFKEDM